MGHIYPYGTEAEAEHREEKGRYEHPRFYSFVIEVDGVAMAYELYWWGTLGWYMQEPSYYCHPVDVSGYDDPVELVRTVAGLRWDPIVDGPFDWDDELPDIEHESAYGPLLTWAKGEGYDIITIDDK